jgi:dihydropyrimidinase
MEQTADILVKNGQLVSSKGIELKDIYIAGEKISKIEDTGSDYASKTIIDAKGKIVIPGIIDAHLHPVYADRISSISQAAISEGVTTIIPYIGSVKAWGSEGDLESAIDDFINEGEADSYVDFGVHCTLMQADIAAAKDTIPALIEKGIPSFKIFMAYAKRGMKLEDADILRVMTIVAQHNGILAAHAENGDIIDYMEEKFIAQGYETPDYYPLSHPNISEAEAIFRLLTLGEVSGCDIFVPHVSAKESLDVIRFFKNRGNIQIYAETCPHYLSLTDKEMSRYGSIAKMAPPLRKQEDIDALWEALKDDTVDMIGSDAAGNSKEKNMPLWDKIFDAPNGIPGIETLFKITYQEGINKGKIPLPLMVGALCEMPAKIFGMYPKKGVLQLGADADLVIIDPEVEYIIPDKNRFLNVDYSIYEGRHGGGSVDLTMLRGKIVYEKGEISSESASGRFIPSYLR